eukprot:CAMPEP_0202450758 /NCGR_PEP_ID=MMETSP1360-20130828/9320_1 /ASSEMBLY_ACC=CAM_ASM_000848 /TAXON_ID=515479 /ORGANISM="Licmophora paradoxa, Strain CCMP2313" /LENGTH=614 /DNA_ID=CAMNT_0049069141 /DNA_START=26 /DNA_END=1870 /DNA_ORIENTATION=+
MTDVTQSETAELTTPEQVAETTTTSPPLTTRTEAQVEKEQGTNGDEIHERKEQTPEPVEEKKALKVLFLSSDTGGGHRASAESLAKQFQLLYPGTTYILHDMQQHEGTPPYNSLVNMYQHLSAHPKQWKLVYEVSNSRAFEMLADAHLKLMCEHAVRKRIMMIDPDVVVSVHPLMTNVPVLSCAKISQKTGKHLPMFTVVTDLGSAHCLWFANGVEKLFVGSDQIYQLAKQRGKVPDEKLIKIGLPIRHDFAIQAEKLGQRTSEEGKAYQITVRKQLNLPHSDRRTILLMGGGEGVGSLSEIVNALYVELANNGINALILVVCGRNEKLKRSLESRDWSQILRYHAVRPKGTKPTYMNCGIPISPTAGCIEGGVTSSIRKILSSSSLNVENPISPMNFPTQLAESSEEEKKCTEDILRVRDELRENSRSKDELVDTTDQATTEGATFEVPIIDTPVVRNIGFDGLVDINKEQGNITVVGLGFVTEMAQYMVAADILVSKAGPGTISEAAALSLPIMLTSYLPGQEEGNVEYVVDGEFGTFISDKDPGGIAEELVAWLNDEEKMIALSKKAGEFGAPYAARDIAKAIGDSTLKWKELNAEKPAHLPGGFTEPVYC